MHNIPNISAIRSGDFKAIARALTLIENGLPAGDSILEHLSMAMHIPVVGITGSPGAGKSSLVNALAAFWLSKNLKVAVLAVDPSSPFNFGSILGDRLRMAGLFLNPNLFIRSVSARGSLGGLSASILSMTELLRNAGFDRILIETVGVGQSEVEIAGVADTTVVVTVPEGGDEVQAMKSGVMEIADIFVVNKSDREGADIFCKYLEELAHSRKGSWQIPVIKTVATENIGIELLDTAISQHGLTSKDLSRKCWLLAEKIESMVIRERMKDFNIAAVVKDLEVEILNPIFNLYNYSKKYF